MIDAARFKRLADAVADKFKDCEFENFACEKSGMELVNEDSRIIANQKFRPRHKHVWANLRNANMV